MGIVPTIRHAKLAVLCLAMSFVATVVSIVYLWLPGAIGGGLLFGYNALALAKWSLRPDANVGPARRPAPHHSR